VGPYPKTVAILTKLSKRVNACDAYFYYSFIKPLYKATP